SSDGDFDLAVFDLHGIGLELDRAVELVFAGAHVVLPAVPRAAQDVPVETTLAERPLQVDAVALQRVDLVPDARERHVLVADPRAGQRAGLELVQARDSFELGHALDPSGEGCPVDCIHEFERILIIDPEECIDCGACEPECPVEAIFPEDALPAKWEAFVKINYAYGDGADVINKLTDEYVTEHNVQNEPLE